MTIEACAGSLEHALVVARDALAAVRLTVVEDVPHANVSLVDRLADRLDDTSAEAEEAAQLAGRLGAAVTPPLDVAMARRSLAGCQQHVLRLARQVYLELVDPDLLASLASLGRERRGEWTGWSRAVRDGLIGCREPLHAAGDAIASCWVELIDRVSGGGVSVHAIGQQITVPETTATAAGGFT